MNRSHTADCYNPANVDVIDRLLQLCASLELSIDDLASHIDQDSHLLHSLIADKVLPMSLLRLMYQAGFDVLYIAYGESVIDAGKRSASETARLQHALRHFEILEQQDAPFFETINPDAVITYAHRFCPTQDGMARLICLMDEMGELKRKTDSGQ